MGAEDDERVFRRLQDALIHSTPDGRELYLTSAQFKASIDALAEMLPLWTLGMAASATTYEARRAQEIERLTRWPPLTGAEAQLLLEDLLKPSSPTDG